MSQVSQLGEQWVGQSIDGRFPLEKYLGGTDTNATFLTQIGGAEGAKAVIKLVLASSCDAEEQLTFWRKAARLSHPNLIRILDGGRCWLAGNDLIFLVTEYADENLGEVLPRRALTPAEAQIMLRPMIAALKYLHHQGLVHGRLRPANVMAVNEQLKISSDCIRPAGETKSSGAATAYDAPELRSGRVSAASDVWSLAAILAESLTPKTTGANGSHKTLPRPFAEIVHRCMQTEPANRWTLNEVEARLRDDTGAIAEKEVAQKETEPPANLRRYLPVVLAAVLLAIVAAIYLTAREGTRRVQPAAAKPAAQALPAVGSSTPGPSPRASATNVAGSVRNQVSPKASPGSLRTIHGRIKVRVRVDVNPAGNVTAEKLVTAGPSKYFSRLAMEAAQQWKFTAPTDSGHAAPSQWTILFEYTRNGISQQASPAER